MKLRNKRTGDIWEFDGGFLMKASHETAERAGGRGCSVGCRANSIADLIENWEDAEPAEPLIKDEEKLDAVKSFFALLGITKEIYYQSINNCFYHTDDDGITYGIDFDNDKGIEKIYTHIAYTITALCGEEEE